MAKSGWPAGPRGPPRRRRRRRCRRALRPRRASSSMRPRTAALLAAPRPELPPHDLGRVAVGPEPAPLAEDLEMPAGEPARDVVPDRSEHPRRAPRQPEGDRHRVLDARHGRARCPRGPTRRSMAPPATRRGRGRGWSARAACPPRPVAGRRASRSRSSHRGDLLIVPEDDRDDPAGLGTGDQVAQEGEARHRTQHQPHLVDDPGPGHRVGHGPGAGQIGGQRLLAEHRPAGAAGEVDEAGVLRRPGAHVDGVGTSTTAVSSATTRPPKRATTSPGRAVSGS